MRVVDETRWRGHSAVLTAVVVAAFWLLSWLLGVPMRDWESGLAFAAVALPTLLVAGLASGRRVREALRLAMPPPRSTLHETAATSRDRRTRFAGVVLTGIVALLIFDHFTDGGGVMAALLAGLLGALGAVDIAEARAWEAAERERETRILVVVRPDALTPRLGTTEVFETPRPGRGRVVERSPFDLEI